MHHARAAPQRADPYVSSVEGLELVTAREANEPAFTAENILKLQ